jgi:prepilin-type N-terminal cleavage/methylation domain-containing protein
MSTKDGFTLLELSIVLVIIGLIAGGITVGADMIRAAELRAVITEHERYLSAVHTFRDKYFALPGDMPNASAFWGETDANPATCLATASTGTETCDGDGNGRVDYNTGVEWFPFWKQLANAGLIEGSYTNIGVSTWNVSIGTNVPESKITTAGWEVYYAWYDASLGNIMYFGRSDGTYAAAPVLRPEEAWSIDKKIDNGLPGSGYLRGQNSGSGCSDYTTDTVNGEYVLTTSDIVCSLLFVNQF